MTYYDTADRRFKKFLNCLRVQLIYHINQMNFCNLNTVLLGLAYLGLSLCYNFLYDAI